MGLLAVTMFCGIIALAMATDVQMAENPRHRPARRRRPGRRRLHPGPGDRPGRRSRLRRRHASCFVVLAAATALVLFLAANTAYNGFPLLGSILAQDRYLPRQLHTRGDRLAFSNGIVLLAGAAALLVVVYGADSTRLIQLYIVGVFVSFTLSQTGMVRHWNRQLRDRDRTRAARRHMIRSRAINAFGAFFTGLVLVVVLVTKFTHGAWVALLGMAIFYATMTRDPPALRPRRRGARRRRGPTDDSVPPLPRPLHRPGLQDPPPDAARPRLRQADALRHPGGAHSASTRPRPRALQERVGASAASTYR